MEEQLAERARWERRKARAREKLIRVYSSAPVSAMSTGGPSAAQSMSAPPASSFRQVFGFHAELDRAFEVPGRPDRLKFQMDISVATPSVGDCIHVLNCDRPLEYEILSVALVARDRYLLRCAYRGARPSHLARPLPKRFFFTPSRDDRFETPLQIWLPDSLPTGACPTLGDVVIFDPPSPTGCFGWWELSSCDNRLLGRSGWEVLFSIKPWEPGVIARAASVASSRAPSGLFAPDPTFEIDLFPRSELAAVSSLRIFRFRAGEGGDLFGGIESSHDARPILVMSLARRRREPRRGDLYVFEAEVWRVTRVDPSLFADSHTTSLERVGPVAELGDRLSWATEVDCGL